MAIDLTRVMVTGAEGFVGRTLTANLRRQGASVMGAIRSAYTAQSLALETVVTGDIRFGPNWDALLKGVDCVVHLAARAHVTRDRASNPIAEFRAVNVAPAVGLFKACQRAGLERFIFVSSIGVNGAFTHGRPFLESDVPSPVDPYAISKWEAEQELLKAVIDGSTKLVVIRPTLVYGRDAKGNFLRLMRLIDSGWPLPFAAITAKRSFLGLTNFCDLLRRCLEAPLKAQQLFVAADPSPMSTADLIRRIADAMSTQPKMLAVPPAVLKFAGSLFGRGSEIERLTGELEVDASKARIALNWQPNADCTRDVEAMVEAYVRAKACR
jgi:nucleoside-diphosphate-sugar epimerase